MGTMTFESEGLYINCCYLHMVAAGELCCLSDNSGFRGAYIRESFGLNPLLTSLSIQIVAITFIINYTHT